MATGKGDILGNFLDQMADAFIQRVLSRMNMNGTSTTGTRGRRASPMKGRKLDMRCRFPGCKNRSGGPRNHFLCPEHLKNPGWRKAKAAIQKAAT